MAEYHEVPEEKYKRFLQILDYAFRPEEINPEHEKEDLKRIGNMRGYFENGRTLSICSLHSFSSFFENQKIKINGISGVATPPKYRHQGHVREMLSEALKEMSQKKQILSILWPFAYRFYEKLGWGMIQTRKKFELNPKNLINSTVSKEGNFRRIKFEDYRDISPVYNDFISNFDFGIRRNKKWWKYRNFSSREKEMYCYCWERDKIESYIFYSIEKNKRKNFDKRMKIREMVFQNERSYLQLLRFIYNHESQIASVSIPGPTPKGVSLFDLVEDPRKIDGKIKPGIMARIVDVKQAFNLLNFNDKLNSRIVIKVKDPLIDKNCNKFTLGPQGSIGTKENNKPHMLVEISTLTKLYLGYMDLNEAILTPQCEIYDEEAKSSIGELFPRREIFINEYF